VRGLCALTPDRVSKRFTVSLKRRPDTNREFFSRLLGRNLSNFDGGMP